MPYHCLYLQKLLGLNWMLPIIPGKTLTLSLRGYVLHVELPIKKIPKTHVESKWVAAINQVHVATA